MAEHMPAQRAAFRQRRNMAMSDKGFEPHRRVVAPIGPAIALPPRAADGVRAHAEPHAELEDARKRAGGRHADHEALQDAEPRVYLHDANEAQNRLGGHETVGIKRDGKLVPAPPALAEIADVAGLEAGVDRTAPIGEGNLPSPGAGKRIELGSFCRRDGRIAGVAQNIDMEAFAHARGVEAAIGSSPRMRAATGHTRAVGLRAKRMMRKPIDAFQKPITDHGKVTAKSASRVRSKASRPPTDRAAANRQRSPAILAATRLKN